VGAHKSSPWHFRYEEGLKDSVQQRINKMTLWALACSSAGDGEVEVISGKVGEVEGAL
jgi:hypothetical protein